MMRSVLFVALVLLTACSKDAFIRPGADVTKRIQEALIAAKPGDVIALAEGKFEIDRPLSLSVAKVRLKGAGLDKTILNFARQTKGSAGLLITAGDFVIEDLTLQDTKGDALKINGAENVTIRRIKTEWTGGPKETNGAYGIYPVQCSNVLIEDSVAIGASDAGIYVGQSKNIIVRRNRAEFNVAGIEIENSTSADVYENVATKNTGGLLVFNLPDLPVQGGSFTRLYNNQVFDNNTLNFAPKGNIVANVPTGTGVMVLATHDIEIFKNKIQNNQSTNISILSYLTTGNPIKDPKFNPFVEKIHIHDNDIAGGGTQPAGRVAKMAEILGNPVPHILYDGVVKPKLENAQICIQNNGDATFINYDAGGGFKKASKDMKPHSCTLPPLAAVSFPGA